jgi:hypothetical protein
MKKNILSIFLILTLGFFDLFGQESPYYEDFNYAYEILTTNKKNRNIEEADSIFEHLFNESDDHHISDIIDVLNRRSRLGSIQNSFYTNTLVKVAKRYNIYKMETNSPLITRREFNSIKRNLGIKSNYKRKTLSLTRMLLKEQKERRKNRDIDLADSINAIKVKKMLADTSLIKNLTYLNKIILELLIFHGGMRNYKQELDLLRYYIGEKRYLSRDLLSTIIERQAVLGGITYKILNNELIPNTKNDLICEINDGFNLFYSNIGKFRYNLNNNQVYVPIDPNLTIEEINQVRKYCFLPDYSQNPHEMFIYPSAVEWCEIVKYIE